MNTRDGIEREIITFEQARSRCEIALANYEHDPSPIAGILRDGLKLQIEFYHRLIGTRLAELGKVPRDDPISLRMKHDES